MKPTACAIVIAAVLASFVSRPVVAVNEETGSRGADHWKQAAGPHHNFVVPGKAPATFSVTHGQGVLWRTPLPNTGESTPVVAGGKVFVTCHAPIKTDAPLGSTVLAMCFDAATGRELWRRELPGTRHTDMASGFSDNTAASPVTDGERVCFVNVGGSMRTFDFSGKLIWKLDWVPFGRHHARQHEPIVYDGKVIVNRVVADDLPETATTKPGAKKLAVTERLWTRLHAYDLATGKLAWVAGCGTSVHVTSMLAKWPGDANKRANSEAKASAGHDMSGAGILTGRGGGHAPLEKPYGLTMLDAATGKVRWEMPIKGYAAHQNAVWNGKVVACFAGMTHHTIDARSGRTTGSVSLDKNVSIRRHTGKGYATSVESLAGKKKKPITYQTNCLVGRYHYFRAFGEHLIGRVNIRTRKVEYLQVPAQIVRQPRMADRVLWRDALPNDVKNGDGLVAPQDKRAMKDGWGHVSAASPIVVGEHLYMPTMIGMVYVLKWNADTLDEHALVSISDLGPAQQTWSLSSLSYARGKLYARTMKELICLGEKPRGSSEE